LTARLMMPLALWSCPGSHLRFGELLTAAPTELPGVAFRYPRDRLRRRVRAALAGILAGPSRCLRGRPWTAVAPAGICGRSAVAAYCLGLLERDLPGKHGTVGLLADLPLSAPDPADAKRRSRNASRAATLGNSKIGAEIRSTRLLVRDIVELTISGDLDPLIRKRLTEIAQLLQVYARLAELEIAAGERPRAGDVVLPDDTAERVKGWAEGEAEREKQREAFLGRLKAVGKDPRAALETLE
jgi:hypothetical protein